MRFGIALAIVVAVLVASPLQAQQKKEDLVDQVRDAIELGKKYLRQQQDAQGRWERGGVIGNGFGIIENGQSCLALLALINAGEPIESNDIQLGLRYIR